MLGLWYEIKSKQSTELSEERGRDLLTFSLLARYAFRRFSDDDDNIVTRVSSLSLGRKHR